MTDATPLHIDQLVKDYGSLRAVDQVTFTIEPGEIFGLLGPNGAGKTTIISIITTLEHATSGSVRVFGHDLNRDVHSCKQQFGVVPQETMSHGFFTAEEVLNFHSGYYGIADNTEWLKHLLERLDLYEHRKKLAWQLSGGMKKRLLIAKALVHRPRLLLLDEPTAGVDIELRDALWDFVRELNQQGTSILLTTHHLEEAEQLCDRVAVIDKGTIQRLGETKGLITELTTREIHLQLRQPPKQESPHFVAEADGVWRFRLPSGVAFEALIRGAGLRLDDIIDIRIEEGTLEHAVRRIIRKEARS